MEERSDESTRSSSGAPRISWNRYSMSTETLQVRTRSPLKRKLETLTTFQWRSCWSSSGGVAEQTSDRSWRSIRSNEVHGDSRARPIETIALRSSSTVSRTGSTILRSIVEKLTNDLHRFISDAQSPTDTWINHGSLSWVREVRRRRTCSTTGYQ